MSRVPLDAIFRKVNGEAAAGIEVYVRERGKETNVTGYTTETEATKVTYPLKTDSAGMITAAWYPPGSYDIYTPTNTTHQTQQWEAVKGGGEVEAATLSSEGVGIILHGASSEVARGTFYKQYIWIGTVEPKNMDANHDMWIEHA